ncbi:hypothetical protein GINT2_001669 [Glugoides intestinalis]
MEPTFSWTQEYRRSWEESAKNIKKKVTIQKKTFNPNKKSIIRHLIVCVDVSSSIEKQDYIPTVRNILSKKLQPFLKRFKDENPLSIVSFLTCRTTFDKYSRVFDPHLMMNTVGTGDFSFLNCLKSAAEFLGNSTYNKEVLIITASTGTKDYGEYDQVVVDLKKKNIKVSMISICGEITLFKKIVAFTNGVFSVPQDSNHFEIILNKFTEPLEYLEPTSCLVKLGFPELIAEPGICNCHLNFETSLYECPVCKSFICKLPNQCPTCDTQLVSPIDISKSYYFMYPLKPFEGIEQGRCRKCNELAASSCTECKSLYCTACSRFMEEELQFCIYCKK